MDSFWIRFAQPHDTEAIFQLIRALAIYEKLEDQMTGSVSDLKEHLFGDQSVAEVLLAEVPTEKDPVGFALFFRNFSTFLTKPGLYLEDLFVQPKYRGCGIGKALLIKVAQIAVERNYGRLDWVVLDWNTPAIDFYQQMGAHPLREWILNRVTGEALQKLAQKDLYDTSSQVESNPVSS
jgi:GNAT superfamily N-acetyltransferase